MIDEFVVKKMYQVRQSLRNIVAVLHLKPRSFVIGIPYLWLLLFFLLPFLIVLKISFAQLAIAVPPYTSIVEWVQGEYLQIKISFENYQLLFGDDVYVRAYLNSVKIAFISTVITLLIGYPMAYAMSKAQEKWRVLLVMLVILPFWTSFLIRVYAWIGILKKEGLLNLFLMKLGVISEPLIIHNTDTAVYIGIVYSYLPFMVLPLYATLERMDESLREAASDLGCHPFVVFWKITLPLSLPGIIAGCFLVFIPAVGEFVIPDLLGGTRTLMIGKTLWVEFFNNRDWPLASAVAVVLLLILIIPIMIFQKSQEKATT